MHAFVNMEVLYAGGENGFLKRPGMVDEFDQVTTSMGKPKSAFQLHCRMS